MGRFGSRWAAILAAGCCAVAALAGESSPALVDDTVSLWAPASCGEAAAPAPRAAGGIPAGGIPAGGMPAGGGSDPAVPGRLLALFPSGSRSLLAGAGRDADGCLAFGQAALDAAGHRLALRGIETVAPIEGLRALSYASEVDPEEAARLLAATGAVVWAEPDYLRRVELVPGDSSYALYQWHLHTIEAAAAWDHATGDPNVLIAVIDTGVDVLHPDLAPNVWENAGEAGGLPGVDDDGNGYVDDRIGYDFVTVDPSLVYPGEDPGPPDPDPSDLPGHGTMVSGVAAAAANNAKSGHNAVGACWTCRIMPLRAGFRHISGAGLVQVSAAAEALAYAADNGARIVNMSYSGRTRTQTEELAVAYARRKGLVLVAAAGNFICDPFTCQDPAEISYPAALPGVLAVAGTDNADLLWADSDALSDFGSKYGPWVDLSAPAAGIFTTFPVDRYVITSGTSFSAPMVAGVAGLILSRNPGLGAQGVEDRLRAGAFDVSAFNSSYAGLMGEGRLDAYRSVVGDRLGVVNPVLDPNDPPPALAITGIDLDPNAPWLAFPGPFPVAAGPGATVFLDPAPDEAAAACGVNVAAVRVTTDDPNAPGLPAEVRFRVECDLDGDEHDCAAKGGGDCDDADPSAHPGAPEVCDGPAACAGTGGEDEDCDGQVDEICSCEGRPNPPASVFVARGPLGGVRVSWVDLADNERGFKVFRRKGNGAWKRIAALGAEARTYDDLRTVPGKVYTYGVKAYNARGASPRAESFPIAP